MASSMNSLQDCLKRSYDSGTNSINVQQPMLTSLGQNTFVLMDFDVSSEELVLLQKFLSTKQVRTVQPPHLSISLSVCPPSNLVSLFHQLSVQHTHRYTRK